MQFWWQSFFRPKRKPEIDLDALTQGLQTALKDSLKSVVLFGSLASGTFHQERSNVNVLVVAHLPFEDLQNLAPAVHAWLQKGHVPPVLLSPEELQRFSRAFPIEFLDMQDTHRVLWGSDPLAGLVVDQTHLRAQCEHDLELLHLRVRQTIAALDGNERKLRRALLAFLPSLQALERAAARFEKSVPQSDKIIPGATQDLAVRILQRVESILNRLKK